MTEKKNMSSVKVFYMGKRLKDMYPHATPWKVFKYKVKRFLRKVLILSIFVGVMAGIVAIVRYAYPMTVYQVEQKEVMIDNLTPKIDELKGGLLADIWNNERAGHNENDALISWDPNPKHSKVEIASIGTCQFKIPTLQEDYLKYYGKQITRKEAILIALDDNKCKEVMAKVIFSNDSTGWQQWYNSGVKYNAKGRLAVINELQS